MGKPSPSKLASSVYWHFPSTVIFPVVIEFHSHGTFGASNRGSRFYLRSNLKKQSLSEFLPFSRKNLFTKRYEKMKLMFSVTLVSQTMSGGSY